MPGGRQGRACSLSFVSIARSPFGSTIDLLLVDDEATRLANGFDRIGGNPPTTLRTVVQLRFILDVFVNRRRVDVSRCLEFLEGLRGSRFSERPSPNRGQ